MGVLVYIPKPDAIIGTCIHCGKEIEQNKYHAVLESNPPQYLCGYCWSCHRDGIPNPRKKIN